MLTRRFFLAAMTATATTAILPRQSQANLVVLPEPLPLSTPIGSGEFVNAPPAWLRFVERFPALHPGKVSLQRRASTKLREAELDYVQRLVNKEVLFTPEKRDVWLPAGRSGDCEDFAIRKLELLVQRFGWPRGALTLATCYAETGQGHAVLLAHTDRGVYALDNRRLPVMPWRALPYRWVAREAPGSPFALWRKIEA